jgi:hypothetical protein
MSRKWGAGVIVFGVLGAAALAGADTPPADPGPFAKKTELAQMTLASIDARVGDIEQLLRQANQEGKAIKASCIDEKLKRAKNNKSTAQVVMDGWAVGEHSLEYAQRQLDRLLLLQVYSMVYTEEARACVDAKAAGNSLDVQVTRDIPDAPKPDPTRPPRFDRPPLASPF